MTPKTLVVVGGAGFLGRSLTARLLAETDVSVRCLDRVACPLTGPRLESLIGGARDRALLDQALAGADAVWIRAGLLGGARGVDVRRWRDYLDVNMELVADVLDACGRSGTKRVFFDSTVMVFGDSSDLTPASLDAEPVAHSFYAATKLVSEKLLRAWAHAGEGRSVQVTRYAHVRGAETPDVLYHMASAALKGGPIRVIGDGDQRIDFVHIDDVVAANIAALERVPRFAVHHVSAGRPVSLFELAARVREYAGGHAAIEWTAEPATQPRFKPYVTGLRWEDTVRELGLGQPRGLDAMIHETLAALRR